MWDALQSIVDESMRGDRKGHRTVKEDLDSMLAFQRKLAEDENQILKDTR